MSVQVETKARRILSLWLGENEAHIHGDLQRSTTRRRFFVAAARSAALLVMAAFATWQETKRRRLASDPNCVKLSVCSDCREFGRCTKPKAQFARGSSSLMRWGSS